MDFSGRTVIGPDPNLRIDEVAVPKRVAKKLTYPEKVTEHNIERLRACVANGANKYPGANYIFKHVGNRKVNLKFGTRVELVSGLRVGDIVDRHLHDGE